MRYACSDVQYRCGRTRAGDPGQDGENRGLFELVSVVDMHCVWELGYLFSIMRKVQVIVQKARMGSPMI